MLSNIGGTIAGAFGYISVTESNTHVTIDGARAKMILNDISNVWSTGRIAMHMFTTATWRKLTIPKFFLIDFHYMIETLAKNESRARLIVGHREYNNLLLALEQGTWLKHLSGEKYISPVSMSKLDALNTELFDYQREWLMEYGRRVAVHGLKGMILPFPPGKGKTLTGIALGECVEADAVVIFAPANTVQEVWEDTIKSRFNTTPKYWTSRSGTTPTKDCKYFVYHYEAMELALDHIHEIFKWKKNVMVIVDESHNFNTDPKNSQRSGHLQTFCKLTNSKHVIFSSGTPIKALGSEMINILRIIDPLFNRFAEERFIMIYGKSSTRAADILARRIGVISYTPDFPEEVKISVEEIDVKVKMPNGEKYTLPAIAGEMRDFIAERKSHYASKMTEYVKLFDRCIDLHKQWLHHHGTATVAAEFKQYQIYLARIRNGYNPFSMREETVFCNKYELTVIMPSLPKELRKDFKNVRSIIKYVDLKIMGEALGGIIGGKRTACHVEMVGHIDMKSIIDEADAKTLIFTTYVEVVDTAYEVLKKQGYVPMRIYGDTNSDFNALIERFKKDVDFNPGIATYQSLSTGVPMVMANTQILVNQPFREYLKKQTIARVARIGQVYPVKIFNTTLDTGDVPNISTRQQDILQWSKEQVEAILGISTPDDLEAATECLMSEGRYDSLESIGHVENWEKDFVLMANKIMSRTKIASVQGKLNQHLKTP